MPRGGSSHDRRRQRRAASRNGAEGLQNALHSAPAAELDVRGTEREMTAEEAQAIIAAASGSTSLPLSDRDTTWDAAAARKSLSDSQFGDAHFWRDSSKPADQITSYKLGFASAASGTLTAIWRGVTACAAVMQGSRGGVQIPDADRDAVKGKISAYYTKAAKKYDDPSIKVPWKTTAADAAAILTRRGWKLEDGFDPTPAFIAAVALANAEVRDHNDLSEAFPATLDAWHAELRPSPERAALALVQSFADGEVGPNEPCANCDHTAMQHEGDDNMGACTVDGCDCDGMQPVAEQASTEATIKLGLHFSDEVVAEAVDVLVAGAELVDLAQADADLGSRLYERVTFRLENLRLEDGEVVAAADGEAEVPEGTGRTFHWQADAVFEGVLTDDGRCFAPGSLTWRQLPLTLGAMLDTPHADVVTESPACGAITDIARNGSVLVARGTFDAGEYGQEIARMVSDGTLRGISVDVAVHASEVAPRLDFFDEGGHWREERIETTPEGTDLLDILFADPSAEPPIWVVTEGVIGAITVCPFPAFAEARIEIAASLVAAASPGVWTLTQQSGMRVTGLGLQDEKGAEGVVGPPGVLTASAEGLAVERPPVDWFENPEFRQLTALTVTDDGRVYGHAAPWGTCHIAIPDVCTEAPRTETDYDFFHLKEVVTDDGARVSCGTITLGTGHAGRGLSSRDTTAHYDNTGTAVADVVVGEDEYGIWVAGALRPDITADQARQLQGAVLSGDWRYVEFSDGTGNLELVALLAVNVPGFPIPRTRALLAAGEEGMRVVALTAAGVHAGHDEQTQLDKISVLGHREQYAALLRRAQA